MACFLNFITYIFTKFGHDIVRLLVLLFLLQFGQQNVAHFLGVAQQHGRVGIVEDWIIDGGVANTQRSFHDDDLDLWRFF
jgi:hypothetical protein